jgi:hypothetical protein
VLRFRCCSPYRLHGLGADDPTTLAWDEDDEARPAPLRIGLGTPRDARRRRAAAPVGGSPPVDSSDGPRAGGLLGAALARCSAVAGVVGTAVILVGVGLSRRAGRPDATAFDASRRGAGWPRR